MASRVEIVGAMHIMNHLIEHQAQLDALQPVFDQLRDRQGILAVDTEFLREKTYSAKLCLVQLGIGDDQYCIDVLAIPDLSALVRLFTDESIPKLLHAARQDMEVIWQTMQVLPKPLFDTQLAAAFCGLDLQIGHTALVLDRLSVELSKSQARTDWTRRPLSPEQIKYAAEDVAHLEALHDLLLPELQASNKVAWFEEEITGLYDISLYDIDPEQAYLRLSGGSLSLPQQYTLKALAAWRESLAIARDIPRSWVLRDDRLYDLAIQRPDSEQTIIDMGVFGRKSAPRLAPQALEIIANVDVGDLPLWRRADPLDKQQKNTVSSMMKKLKELAAEHEIAQGLLATRKDIESLYRYHDSQKLMRGWRTELVGEPLLALAKS